jgi:hypothetical protein
VFLGHLPGGAVVVVVVALQAERALDLAAAPAPPAAALSRPPAL